MTEAEWLACEDPRPMIEHLRTMRFNRDASGRRRLRLFGCACARRTVQFMTERGHRFVSLGEKLADNLLTPTQRKGVDLESFGDNEWQKVEDQADIAAYFTLAKSVVLAADAASRSSAECFEVAAWHEKGDTAADDANRAEQVVQTHLIHDIFGNPFRPVTFSPSWRTDTTVALARQMYESRDFGAMPILADALQDAGCDNADVLAHCREEGAAHVRGCWVCDLVLGKE